MRSITVGGDYVCMHMCTCICIDRKLPVQLLKVICKLHAQCMQYSCGYKVQARLRAALAEPQYRVRSCVRAIVPRHIYDRKTTDVY